MFFHLCVMKMFVVKLLFLFVIYVKSDCIHADHLESQGNVQNNRPVISQKCNSSSQMENGYGVRFQLPFLDMEILNREKLLIMQDSVNQSIFVLHGYELYYMTLTPQSKHLSYIAVLQSVNLGHIEPSAAAIISWRQYFIVALAFEQQVEVYQIAESLVQKRREATQTPTGDAGTPPMLEPIQQLTLGARFQQFYLIDPAQDQLLLTVAAQSNEKSAKIRNYKWLQSYFNPVDDFTVPPINLFQVVGAFPKYVLNGRFDRMTSNTILTINEITVPRLKMQLRQTLTIVSTTAHTFTYHGHNYLINCAPKRNRCTQMRMQNGKFKFYQRRSGNEFVVDQIVAGSHFLVTSYMNEVKVYNTAQLNCFASYKADESKVTSIMPYSYSEDEAYVVLNYQQPTRALVRVVNIEVDQEQLLGSNHTEPEDLAPLRQHQHMFEESVGQLRSLLLQRKRAMDVFRQVSSVMSPKLNRLSSREPVNVLDGHIGLIKITNRTLRSPMQLLQRISDLAQRQTNRRFRRMVNAKTVSSPSDIGNLKVQRLRVENLIYKGDLLKGFYMDNTTKPSPILSVRTKVVTKSLETPRLLARNLARRTRMVEPLPYFNIGNLKVERINNVSWAEFYNSLFLKNRDNTFDGSLTFQSDVVVSNLSTPLLNGLFVDDFFNLKNPQTIKSNLFVPEIFARELNTSLVNGLDFTEDIVFNGKHTLVAGPVKLRKAKINSGILVDSKESRKTRTGNEENELQQFYTGKVIINGSLTVNTLRFDSSEPNSNVTVLVGDKVFSQTELEQKYLLKTSPQTFNSTVVFDNVKVIVPSLKTVYLNDHPTEEHLLRDGIQNSSQPLLLAFLSGRVEGDVICGDNSSKLMELNQNIVRQNEEVNITGTKVFQAPLTVDALLTMELNELPVAELVTKQQLQNVQQVQMFNGPKRFDSIKVTDSMTVKDSLNTSYLNNLLLDHMVNYNYYLGSIQMSETLSTANIVFHKLNNISFDEVFTKLSVENETVVMHKDLIIDGNMTFTENLNVKTINGIDWQGYLDSLVRVSENAVIEGPKRFMRGLTVMKQLNTPLVNELKVSEFFDNVLVKSKPQLISGNYTFGSLCTSNLDVAIINDVSTETFMDMRKNDTIVIQGDLVLPKITVLGNVKGDFKHKFNFDTLAPRLQQMPKRNYRNLVVLGNAMWNTSTTSSKINEELLRYLHKYAVRRDADQLISGNVKLSQPLIANMLTKSAFPSHIDLDFIAGDCLLQQSDETQSISAPKTFTKTMQMQQLQTENRLNVKMLNKIDLLRLNSSLYRVSSGEPIVGPLHFNVPLTVRQLTIDGMINNVAPSQIYGNLSAPLPPLKIHELFVDGTLIVEDVNDMNLNYLLANRITKHGAALEVFGTLTFECLILNKEILLQSINNIPIDDLVFKQSNQLQTITGSKFVNGDLTFVGPSHVTRLNGQNLVDNYEESIFANGDYYFDNMRIDAATFEGGLLSQSETRNAAADVERQRNRNRLRHLERLVNETMVHSKPQFMYLDYDYDLEILYTLPPSNELCVQMADAYEVRRISACEREWLTVQECDAGKRLYVANVTSNRIRVRTDQLSVEAENYCHRNGTTSSIINIRGLGDTRTYTKASFVESVAVFTYDSYTYYVLVHSIDKKDDKESQQVTVVRVDMISADDWQSIGVYPSKIDPRLLTTQKHTVLTISHKDSNNDTLLDLYEFDNVTNKFVFRQPFVGAFDVVEVSELANGNFQLFLTCTVCDNMYIYDYVPDDEDFMKATDFIHWPTRVKKVHTFNLGDGNRYLLMLPAGMYEFYNLYKHSSFFGWQRIVSGQFTELSVSLPLIDIDKKKPPKILLCNDYVCQVVNIIIRD